MNIKLPDQVHADWKPMTSEEWAKHRAECFESEKISQHCQEEIKKGEFPPEPGCYFRCIGLKAGMWDDTHGFNMERSHDSLTANGWEVDKDNLKKCYSANQKDDDPCKWAAAIAKCMFDNKYLRKKA